MATPSCTERTNWYKCNRLLIEGGRAVLKEFLKKSCPGTIDNFLALNKAQLEYLYKRKILNQCQWNKLFPQSDIESMDITLLNCIISNCITQPSTPERTALDSIRDLRNNLYGHVCNLMMDECEFKTNWKSIKDALSKAQLVFNINIPLQNFIDTIQKEEVVNMELVKDELEAWKRIDNVLGEQSSKISEVSGELKKKKNEMSSEILYRKDGLKKNNSESSSEILCIKNKLQEVEVKRRQKGQFQREGSNDADSGSLKKKSRQMSVTVKQEFIAPALKQDLSELQTCLVNYYTKYLIKSPVTATASSSSETDIDDIYAEPKLELVHHTALRKSAFYKEVSLSVKDILFNDGKKCLNIYITGDAGMGKTSLCKWILSNWCKAWQTNNPSDELEMALRQYVFLFYISLRNAYGQNDIQNMIVSQLLKYIMSYNKTLSNIQPEFLLHELLEDFSEKCLIILDGLDEWTTPERSSMPPISNGVPGRNPALNYTIMTSTRPWKLEELRLKDSEIDRQIHITGVKDNITFSKKLISHFNEIENRNMIYEDFQLCLQNADLTAMCETPIHLKHMICLWFNNQDFGKSKTEVYTNIIELWLLNAEKREGVRHLNQLTFIDFDENIATPGVFKKTGKCERYKALLKSVGRLAFETTMHEKRMQLIFESPEEYGLKEHQLRLCLTVGILSTNIVPDMVCEKIYISFPHKTFHEYFAALYMGWHSSIPDDIILDENKRNVLIFLSGIWPSVSEKILKTFQAGKFGKDYVPQKCSFLEGHYQQFVMDCCQESANQNKVCLNVKLRCILFLNDDKQPFHWKTSRSMIRSQDNCRKFFSLMSQMHQQKILQTNGDNIMLDFSELRDLVYLQLAKLDLNSLRVNSTLVALRLYQIKICPPDGMIALLSSISKAESLKSLECDSIKCTNAEFTVDKGNRYSQMRNIECIEDASKQEYFLSMDLSKLIQVSQISLSNLLVSELKLSPVIKDLTLQDIEIAQHDGIVSLMESVSNIETLDKIYINNIKCTENASSEDCGVNIELSKLTKLKNIVLRNIWINELRLSPIIKTLSFQDIKISQHCGIVSLMENVSRMETIEILSMNNIQCAEQSSNGDYGLNIDMSKLTMLRNIDLRNICISELSLSPIIEVLILKNIKIAHDGIVSLIESVLCMETLREMEINNILFPTQASCFLNRDQTKTNTKAVQLRTVKLNYIRLRYVRPNVQMLTLHNIKLAHDAIVSLMKLVSSMERLNRFNMHNIHCTEHRNNEDCAVNIDLSKLAKMKNIKLRNIRISELSFRPDIERLSLEDIKISQYGGIVSLLESVLGMETLRKMHIHNIHFTTQANNEDCFLNKNLFQLGTIKFDYINSQYELQETQTLTLQNIKLAHHAIVSLMKHVFSMKKLEAMKLKNIHCTEHASTEDCVMDIDLSKLIKLRNIVLRNIRISELSLNPVIVELTLQDIKIAQHGVIVSLMESVSSMESLKIISMNNIHCTDHLGNEECCLHVDLSKLGNLRTIKLANITIRELQVSPCFANCLVFKGITIANHDVLLSLKQSGIKYNSLTTIHCSEHGSDACFETEVSDCRFYDSDLFYSDLSDTDWSDTDWNDSD